jgi:hypothetical protein
MILSFVNRQPIPLILLAMEKSFCTALNGYDFICIFVSIIPYCSHKPHFSYVDYMLLDFVLFSLIHLFHTNTVDRPSLES